MLSIPLPTVETNPAAATVAVVIWLHGLGADGHDFEPIVPELRLPPGYLVEWHEYPMGHEVCQEEIQEISRWLQSILGLHR